MSARMWRAARLVEVRAETAAARTLRFEVDGWAGHLPGQHVDVRLTAEDGYTTQRSYSLSAPQDGTNIEITVQLVADGEVSPYLVGDIEAGDSVEILGPLGGWFVWRAEQPEPILLLGGGSGVAPLMAMRRAHAQALSPASMRLIYSVRTPADVYFAAELRDSSKQDAVLLFTRTAPGRDRRGAHRIDAHDIATHAWPPDQQPTSYVCGPTPFVETVIALLLAAGHDPARIRAERFGATGG
jgi:ferredoxin-NADP reductase